MQLPEKYKENFDVSSEGRFYMSFYVSDHVRPIDQSDEFSQKNLHGCLVFVDWWSFYGYISNIKLRRPILFFHDL
jgi:hypothetical protein